MNIKTAESIVGGLSSTSKMPTLSISLPASECKTGSKLRKVKGSVCSTCYAMKGCYNYGNVKQALAVRLDAISNDQWINAMVYLINNKKKIKESKLFRWHDSGDIQSFEHLHNIIQVCKATPHIKHWIPTKEKKILRDYTRTHTLPDNVVIRLSGAMINGDAPKGFTHTSTVTTDRNAATCRAFDNDDQCGDCRQCWDKSIANIVYLEH